MIVAVASGFWERGNGARGREREGSAAPKED